MNTPPSHAQSFLAPAKLNLDLRIIGRRIDGYHELETVFCLINLYDIVYLAPRNDNSIHLHTSIEGVPYEQDLSYRAAYILQKHSQINQGVDIWLEKNIPMGGGLGGGSSDAATVLMALNRLWKCQLNRSNLMQLGIKLGADVPFFIFGRNAFAQGIGEKLREIAIPKQWYVVVKPNIHISTGVIFSHKDLTRDSKPTIMPTFQNIQPFRNDMQAVVLETYPEVLKAYQTLQQYGLPLMTGSGACLFISCKQLQEAQTIYNQVSQKYQTYLVGGLLQHPLFDN